MRRSAEILCALAVALAFCFPAPAVAQEKAEKEGAQEQQPEPRLNIPIPIGHKAKGVKLPYFDMQGKLRMNLHVAAAKRIDEDHLQLSSAKVEMFDDAGEPDMQIEMPTSTLDLNTNIISSKEAVTIRRSDFELTGETMQFDVRTRRGKLFGKVRMLIYDRKELAPEGADREQAQ